MGVVSRCLILVLVIVWGVGLAGCGSSRSVRVVGGTVEVGRGVSEASLLKSVVGIKIGTRASGVRARLGEPFARVAAGSQTCWAYHAKQGRTSLDAIDFCMSRRQRVERISIGVHG
jgi:hypothetical protein